MIHIQVVANNEFLAKNPAAKRLFEDMSIPLEDIFAQNALMYKDEDKPADLERQADEWIKAHQQTFDSWVDAAKKAAQRSDLSASITALPSDGRAIADSDRSSKSP